MKSLRFLWASLTTFCNLECVHCCTDSGPRPLRRDVLREQDWLRILCEARLLGCDSMQFTGGEATTTPFLPGLIRHARNIGIGGRIGINTNAVHFSEDLKDAIRSEDVFLRVSVYGTTPEVHDSVTLRRGSYDKTLANVEEFLAQGVVVEGSVRDMPENDGHGPGTKAALLERGLAAVNVKEVFGIGRGVGVRARQGYAPAEQRYQVSDLCGGCWQNSVAVLSEGKISPCVAASTWGVPFGNGESLAEALESDEFEQLRRRIYKESWIPRRNPGADTPDLLPNIGDLPEEDVMNCGPSNHGAKCPYP